MKKLFRLCAAILVAAAILTLFGCSGNKDHELNVPATEGSPISPKRTGATRQGISAHLNGFECTSKGSYFMWHDVTKEESTGTWLLYGDHGSDTVIKLCGRPDCSHDDSDCNAYFLSADNICYYDGYLYTYSNAPSSNGIIRMNTDGSERLLVYDVSAFMAENGYKGISSPLIRDGVFLTGFTKLNEDGDAVYEGYYYRLDGSMERLEPFPGLAMNLNPDGDVLVGVIDYDNDGEQYIYGIWDPKDGSTTELFRDSELIKPGYFGSEAMYYIENGVVYERSYTEGVRVLFDTGLRGNGYRLICFPDIIVIHDIISSEEMSDGLKLESLTLRFYDWNFNDIGSVDVDFDFCKSVPVVICGEMHERIILTDNFDCFPRYYIDKSDLGTGNIKIHKYKLPDFE